MFLYADNFERLSIKGKQYGILILNYEHAEEYLEIPFIKNSESGKLESIGLFLDKHDDIIGINTKEGENIYDSQKIIKKIQSNNWGNCLILSSPFINFIFDSI